MFNTSRTLDQGHADRSEPQYCSQALMLPVRSWLAPATVPQADTNVPTPRTAKIARARLHPRNRSRRVIKTSCDPFPNAALASGRLSRTA
jgi:hypothetical protein